MTKYLILLILLIPSLSFAGEDWTTQDKLLFGGVCLAQFADGIATQRHLKENSNNYIHSYWSWKYGTDRPSSTRLWAVKLGELGLAYLIADNLPKEYTFRVFNHKFSIDLRQSFLISAGGLLIGCTVYTW